MKKDIKNYEGLYTIDKAGVIFSTPSDGKKPRQLIQEVLNFKHTSYRRVTLSKNGKVTRFRVHRLVAETFIPNPMNKPQVNHKNNNGLDNYVDNLEWSTGKENMKHSSVQGRQNKCRSLGGKANGTIRKDNAKIKYDSMIGKIYGQRKLISISNYGQHPKGMFMCLVCKKEFKSGIDKSLENKTNYRACRGCNRKHNNREKI